MKLTDWVTPPRQTLEVTQVYCPRVGLPEREVVSVKDGLSERVLIKSIVDSDWLKQRSPTLGLYV